MNMIYSPVYYREELKPPSLFVVIDHISEFQEILDEMSRPTPIRILKIHVSNSLAFQFSSFFLKKLSSAYLISTSEGSEVTEFQISLY